jgi:hypothetical protein
MAAALVAGLGKSFAGFALALSVSIAACLGSSWPIQGCPLLLQPTAAITTAAGRVTRRERRIVFVNVGTKNVREVCSAILSPVNILINGAHLTAIIDRQRIDNF